MNFFNNTIAVERFRNMLSQFFSNSSPRYADVISDQNKNNVSYIIYGYRYCGEYLINLSKIGRNIQIYIFKT